jgi:hypothetical protein
MLQPINAVSSDRITFRTTFVDGIVTGTMVTGVVAR